MNLNRTLAALGLTLAFAGAAYAQTVEGLDGRWDGALEVGPTREPSEEYLGHASGGELPEDFVAPYLCREHSKKG